MDIELLPADALPARIFPQPSHYTVGDKFAEGAMGTIHLARDLYLRRRVAYKQVQAQQMNNPITAAHFLNEVQITAQLDHPNIVPIYMLESTDSGALAYSMKWVRGKTLKDVIEEAKASPLKNPDYHQMLEPFLKVCDAMAYAHSKGVLHRDLKPANIMLGPYHEAYVMDWGIACLIGEKRPDEKGKIVGTPRYMSPEQAAGMNDHLDARSDLFALGAILYELVTLKSAFTGTNHVEVLKKIIQGQIAPIASSHAIPPELIAIIYKAMARRKRERYRDVSEFAQDIRRFLRGEEVLARPDSWGQKIMRWMGHHQVLILSLLAVIFLLSATITIGVLYQRQIEIESARQREEKLNALLNTAFQQSQAIDRQFLRFQIQLEGLANVAAYVLTRGQPSHDPYYVDNASWENTVPDLIPSRHYGGRISPNHAGFSIAFNEKEADVRDEIQLLNPLRFYLKRMLIQSSDKQPSTPEQIQTLIADEGVPLIWASVISKEGINQYFPGKGYNTPGYDPRVRPFYKLSAHKYGIYCGNPYMDRLTGALLSCSTSIYATENQQFLGVASIDIQFNYLIDRWLSIPNVPEIKDTYLLDTQGRILLKGSDRQERIEAQQKTHAGFDMKPFPNPDVQAAIQQKRSGFLAIEKEQKILVYHRLLSLGWYYVVEVDASGFY